MKATNAIRQSLGAERAEDRALAADLAKGINRPRRPVQDGLGIGGQPIGEGGPGGGRGRGAGGGGRGAGPGGPPPVVDPERPNP